MHPDLRRLKRAIAMIGKIEDLFDAAGFPINDNDVEDGGGAQLEIYPNGCDIHQALFTSSPMDVEYFWEDGGHSPDPYEDVVVTLHVTTYTPHENENHVFLRFPEKKPASDPHIELVTYDKLNSETEALLREINPGWMGIKEREPLAIPFDVAIRTLEKIVAYVARRKAELEKATIGAA
jgi:hypothetical protein